MKRAHLSFVGVTAVVALAVGSPVAMAQTSAADQPGQPSLTADSVIGSAGIGTQSSDSTRSSGVVIDCPPSVTATNEARGGMSDTEEPKLDTRAEAMKSCPDDGAAASPPTSDDANRGPSDLERDRFKDQSEEKKSQ